MIWRILLDILCALPFAIIAYWLSRWYLFHWIKKYFPWIHNNNLPPVDAIPADHGSAQHAALH